MPRQEFRQGLEHLHEDLRLLTSRVDKAISTAMEALRTRDMNLARSVGEGDLVINRQRYDMEEEAIRLMALQAPVATDLRDLVCFLSIVTDLERVGDHAEGIARIALFLGEDPMAANEPALWSMADKAQDMLRRAVNAFLDRDEAAARNVCELDDEVDATVAAGQQPQAWQKSGQQSPKRVQELSHQQLLEEPPHLFTQELGPSQSPQSLVQVSHFSPGSQTPLPQLKHQPVTQSSCVAGLPSSQSTAVWQQPLTSSCEQIPTDESQLSFVQLSPSSQSLLF